MDQGTPDAPRQDHDWVSYRRCRRRERVKAGGDQATATGPERLEREPVSRGQGSLLANHGGFQGRRLAGTGMRRVRLHPVPYPNPAGSLNRHISTPISAMLL